MTMPPSGVEGLMDEESSIEAQIHLELENINLDDEVADIAEDDNENQGDGEDESVVYFSLGLIYIFHKEFIAAFESKQWSIC